MNSEILSLLSDYKNKTFVIKYGGSIMNNLEAQKAFTEDVKLLRQHHINVVIVHGGGPEISRWLKKAGVENKFINGLRVTDAETMEIVEMVLSGSVNKTLSSNLTKSGLTSVGISGRDANLIKAKKKYLIDKEEKIDIGFVGEVVSVDASIVKNLLNSNVIPVISPIGSDDEGNPYNINADYAASAVAGALNADKLIIMTDIAGVYKDINDPDSLLASLTIDEIKQYISEGIINGGMIPKMECCMEAIMKGTKNVHLVDGRKLHSLLSDTFEGLGTKIIY
jgi:acetylglutamate kinase